MGNLIRNGNVINREGHQKDNIKEELGTLWILAWNCHGFPWRKGPMLSWISGKIDIILLVETWEYGDIKSLTSKDLSYDWYGTRDLNKDDLET